MGKYYYVVIDKQEKTLQVVECNTCLAVLEKEIQAKYNLANNMQVENRFRFFFNGEENKINYETLYKYARKYKEVA